MTTETGRQEYFEACMQPCEAVCMQCLSDAMWWACRAGMRTLLVTGDHLLTAISTAYASGILKVHDYRSPNHALPCPALCACRRCRLASLPAAALGTISVLISVLLTGGKLLCVSSTCLPTAVYCSSLCLPRHGSDCLDPTASNQSISHVGLILLWLWQSEAKLVLLDKNPSQPPAQSAAESGKPGPSEDPTSPRQADWAEQGTPPRLRPHKSLRPDDQDSAGVPLLTKAQNHGHPLASALKGLCRMPSLNKVHLDEWPEGNSLLRDSTPKPTATQGIISGIEMGQVDVLKPKHSAALMAPIATCSADGAQPTQPELSLCELSFVLWDGSRHLQDMSQVSEQSNPLEIEATQEKPGHAQSSTGESPHSSCQRVLPRATIASVATGKSVIQHAAALTCKLMDKTRGSPQPISHIEALTLVAQGAPCAVTGPFFEHMLQHAEPALLEVMLRGMAVGGDMRASQKALLVKLMGSEGFSISEEVRFQVSAWTPGHLILSAAVVPCFVQSCSSGCGL